MKIRREEPDLDRINMCLNCVFAKTVWELKHSRSPWKLHVFFSMYSFDKSVNIKTFRPDLCLLHTHFFPIRKCTAMNLPIIPEQKKKVFF